MHEAAWKLGIASAAGGGDVGAVISRGLLKQLLKGCLLTVGQDAIDVRDNAVYLRLEVWDGWLFAV
jgi:hypothetical protein